jgi:TrmH family RNA methyltransferase
MTEEENRKCSGFDTPPGVLALVRMPKVRGLDMTEPFVLALDGISDPGNMGTIIRLADWYGLRQILASEDCVDVYNAKCLSATMGSFLRVEVVYSKLHPAAAGRRVYGAFLNGKSVHEMKIQNPSMLIIGSESHGIRPEAESLVTEKITIPGKGHAESLNAGIATAILLDNLLR